jgi:hypothetical protein
MRRFHWSECVSDAETALYKDRYCHAALAIKAKAHLKQRHYRAAIRDFEQLLELYPWAPVITELNQVNGNDFLFLFCYGYSTVMTVTAVLCKGSLPVRVVAAHISAVQRDHSV